MILWVYQVKKGILYGSALQYYTACLILLALGYLRQRENSGWGRNVKQDTTCFKGQFCIFHCNEGIGVVTVYKIFVFHSFSSALFHHHISVKLLIYVHKLLEEPPKPTVLTEILQEWISLLSIHVKQQYFLHQDLDSVLILLGVRFFNLCCWLSMFWIQASIAASNTSFKFFWVSAEHSI